MANEWSEGPWHAMRSGRVYSAKGAGQRLVAEVPQDPKWQGGREDRANLRLVTQAPALADALRRLVNLSEHPLFADQDERRGRADAFGDAQAVLDEVRS